jgi:small multidrug resistance pump
MADWLLLAAAIIAEVGATAALKLSDGFTRPIPSAAVVAGYVISFYLLAKILAAGMDLGVVYAIWSGLGLSLVVLIDVLWFDQRLGAVQIAGMFLVVAGVAALQLGGAGA